MYFTNKIEKIEVVFYMEVNWGYPNTVWFGNGRINKLPKVDRNADLAEALMEFGAVVCKPQNPLCKICHLQKYCKFFNGKNYISLNKKFSIKEKKINIYCYLNKKNKKIALTKN